MDEDLFWRRMTPARLHALYDAWLPKRDAGPKQEQPKSLSAYLRGG